MDLSSTEDVIRKLVLKGGAECIKGLFLNKSQIELLNHIGTSEMTSSQLARERKLSVQHANIKLERLRRSGYLTRENVGDPTGGNMFVYECTSLVINCSIL